MNVLIYDTQDDLSIDHATISTLSTAFFQSKKIHTDQLIIHFISKPQSGELHQYYFNDPSPTDCITFPYDQAHPAPYPHIIGEVFICPAIAIEQAPLHATTPHKEIFRYLIHTLLHLIGFTDTTLQAKARMHAEETETLAALRRALPNILA